MSVPLWLTVVAAFLTATLSGLGVGSAGLFVLYLTGICGMAQTEAQALNLVFFLCSAGASFLFHARHRRVPGALVAFLIACALPGVLLGTHLVQVLDSGTVRRMFGGMLILCGAGTLWQELIRTRRERRARRGREETP